MTHLISSRLWIAAAAFGMALGAGAAARAANERPDQVRIETTDEMGGVLADSRGMTLYTWRGDRKANESLCDNKRYTHANGAGSMSYELPEPQTRPVCTQIWPPFLASADAKPVGDWAVFTRPEGTRQWSYKGKPLYTYVEDHRPGEINGLDGASGRFATGRYPAWAPLDAPRGVVAITTQAGRVLMTETGKVLYVTNGKGGVVKAAACKGDCAGDWKPLAAPAVAAEPPKGWTIVSASDGGRQWAFQGKPVYTYSGDARFGELNGADEPGWQAATLQKPLPAPADLTIQTTAIGYTFADRNGMTVYSFGCGDEGPARAVCDIPGASQTYRLSICGAPETCIKTWRPVVASPGSKPVGRTWTIVDVDATGANQYALPGQKNVLKVWAYRGRPIYTFAADKRPGDMLGDNLTNGGLWGYGMVRADGADPRGQL